MSARVVALGLCVVACGAAPGPPARSSSPSAEVVEREPEVESTACIARASSAPLDDAICQRCASDLEPTVHPSLDGLAIELVDPGPLQTGAVHTLEVRLTNRGERLQRIVLGPRVVGVSLSSAAGAVEADRSVACRGPVEVQLEPGGSLVLHPQLSLLHGGYDCFELSKNCFPSTEPVAPGTYELSVYFDLRRVPRPAGPGDYARVLRTITVVAP